jgi:Kdo2-lipid IVA lauroyltransferase/acyltransferase
VDGKRLRRAVRAAMAASVLRPARLLPEGAAYRLAPFFGRWALHTDPGHKTVLENIRLAFGEEMQPPRRREIAAGFYAHLFLMYWEAVRLRRWSAQEVLRRSELAGEEHLRAALARGKGVLMMTGHMGNWELGGVALAALGYPVSVMYREREPIGIHDYVLRTRAEHGVENVGESDLRRCLSVLKEGRIMVLLVDGRALKQSRACVPFFGRPAFCPTGPARLALKTGASVLFAGTWRTGPGRFRTELSPELPPVRTGTPEHEVWLNSAHYQGLIEREIRRRPEQQWLWYRRKWRLDGEEPGPLYEELSPKLNELFGFGENHARSRRSKGG